MPTALEAIKNNPVMDEYIRRVNSGGMYLAEYDKNGGVKITKRPEISHLPDNSPVLEVRGDGAYRYSKESVSESMALREIYDYVKDYVTTYEKAPQLEYDGVKSYRKLCEFNNTVLAGNHQKDGKYEFVTWRVGPRDALPVSVGNGNYFSDYTKAKDDFAKRSGLVDHLRYFDKDMLETVYKHVCEDMEGIRNGLPAKESSELYQLNAKLRNLFPDVTPEQPELQFEAHRKCLGRSL